MTDRPPTDQPTDRPGHREISLPIIAKGSEENIGETGSGHIILLRLNTILISADALQISSPSLTFWPCSQAS